MNTEMLMQYITYALGGIGILAFLVSVVVQAIKEMPVLKKIQTNVVALGVVANPDTDGSDSDLCASITKIVIEWYYVFASFLAAFIVYLVSTGGWERITEIWNRSKYKE